MSKRFPIYPLIFGLYPALFLLSGSIDPLNQDDPLRQGALWLLAGIVLFGLFSLILRSPHRAGLLVSFWLLFVFAYNPVYEVLRGGEILGGLLGRHRYLIPLWLILLATGTFLLFRIKPIRKPALFLDIASLVLFVPLLIWVITTGAWLPSLRAAGILPPPQVEVTFIDVGDLGPNVPGAIGDAILLRTSEGKTAMIDGGYPNKLAVDYLADYGVDHLDIVVLTHADDDHSGGLIDVLKTIPVGLLVWNGQSLDSDTFRQFEEAMRTSGVNTRVVRSGDKIPFGSLIFDVLSPPVISEDNVNLSSIVMRLEVGKVAFLFTGDTYRYEELRLVESGIDIHADILKVGHHGSGTSTDPAFVARVNPAIAVYQAGLGNEDGFPYPVTMETLNSAGVEVYGTDNYGTIVVTTDGKTFDVITERGGTD